MKAKILDAIFATIIALALSTLVACTAGFNSSPYYDLNPAKPQKGVTYKLPKTVIDYTVSFTLYSITNKPADKEVTTYEVWVEGENQTEPPLSLTPKHVGDDRAVFLIKTQDLAAFTVHTKGTGFSLSNEGVLTAANGEFDDKTGEITEKFVSAGFKLAKLAANPAGAAGRSVDDNYPKTEKLGTITTKGQINYAREQERQPTIIEFEVPTLYVQQQFQRKTHGTSINIPAVSFVFTPETCYKKLTAVSAAEALESNLLRYPTKKYRGLWVRQPGSVPFKVKVGGAIILEDRMLIADAGPTTLVPIRSRMMTDRSTTVAFHGETGSVSKHEFTSTSQGEKLATTVDTLSDTVSTQVTSIIQARQSRADAKDKVQTEIAVEERKIRDAESDIADIDSQLAGLDQEEKDLEKKLRDADEADVPDEEYKELEKEVTGRKKEMATEKKTLGKNRKTSLRSIEDAEREIEYLKAKQGRI